ncbi:DUF4232 domain-containing protein [Streptomyces sp. NPDC002514]|uniref:DUF4232 domain-containing protein n=1 Tax=Streptomyces sp. NPDC001270 TaxID=3364554 RepID=UPI00367FC9B2
MRSSKKLPVLALVVAAAGLSLTACNPGTTNASGTVSASGSVADQAGSSGGGSSTGGTTAGSGSQTGSAGSGSSGSGSNSGGTSGGSGSSASGSGSGSGSASGGMCKTANLTFSAYHGISGEGQEIVSLKNSGSSTCTMHGFPGVDLSNGSDTTVSADCSNSDVPTVKLAPGEKTEFVLNYPFNNSGGTGFTFTTLIVTPPNETHSKTLSVAINVPVDNPDAPSNGGITVNAVGAGK